MILATVLILIVPLALTVYVWTTRKDFSVYEASLWIAGWSSLAFSLLFFLRAQGTVAYTPEVILRSIISIIVYSIYLICAPEMLMERYQLGLDDYILASICIYLDIVVQFTKILRVLGSLNKEVDDDSDDSSDDDSDDEID